MNNANSWAESTGYVQPEIEEIYVCNEDNFCKSLVSGTGSGVVEPGDPFEE